MPRDFIREVAILCHEANEGIGLSENVFDLPLHISLKKSFRCDRFPEIRDAVRDYFTSRGPFTVTTDRVVLHKGMIWLTLKSEGELLEIHRDLDRMLHDSFGVPIHPFDRRFLSHISLFTKGDKEDIDAMYDILRDEFQSRRLTVSRIVVGASNYSDEFIDI